MQIYDLILKIRYITVKGLLYIIMSTDIFLFNFIYWLSSICSYFGTFETSRLQASPIDSRSQDRKRRQGLPLNPASSTPSRRRLRRLLCEYIHPGRSKSFLCYWQARYIPFCGPRICLTQKLLNIVNGRAAQALDSGKSMPEIVTPTLLIHPHLLKNKGQPLIDKFYEELSPFVLFQRRHTWLKDRKQVAFRIHYWISVIILSTLPVQDGPYVIADNYHNLWRVFFGGFFGFGPFEDDQIVHDIFALKLANIQRDLIRCRKR